MNSVKKLFIGKPHILAVAIFLTVLAWYFLTWSPVFMGYEKETALSALAFWHGNYQIFRAGLSTILLYQPFVFLGTVFFPNKLEMVL